MRTVVYILWTLGEFVADGVVWLWNKFSRNAPIKIDDYWTDGT